MVKFEEVNPHDMPTHREGRRGRVSYPIIKSFLETGMVLAKLDRTGMQQSFQSLYSCLNSYARNHEIPVKIFSRSGELYLMRLDFEVDKDGNKIPVEDWQEQGQASEGREGVDRKMEAKPLSSEEVATRFQEEKAQVTK
jgi:hypothetical protein